MRCSAFLQLLAMRLTKLPGPNRYDLEKYRRKAFLLYLRNKGKSPCSHPILPGLQVDIRCFQHVKNMRMHQYSQSKMVPFGTLFCTPQSTKDLRRKFLELYCSEKEFVMFMSCTRGIFIRMHFTPDMSGEGYQLVFQVFGGTRSLFQTKVDATLEKATSKFQVALKIHEHHQRVSFFYDNKIFFPIPFSVGRYSEVTAEVEIVSLSQAIHGYKPSSS